MMKRIFDIAASAAGLVVLSPVCAAVALAVWVNDPGPVIHRGPRVGKDGQPFDILKFRSMRVSQGDGPQLTAEGDPRVTHVGRFLRRTKLDELPQLVNVLRGEMSLVGPRPEAPRYVAQYTPEQRRVLAVRPGITGPAQIRFRHEERLLAGPDPERHYLDVIMPAKLEIDLAYAHHASLRRDLAIIMQTLSAVASSPQMRAIEIAPKGVPPRNPPSRVGGDM
jgi:lipopolysaccharide/colanic/teichoic acid biosynthesis glycosyltransferase